MNEEREDTELAELLKQLPAPTRLDAARRNAIFTALPQGRAPRKTSYSWSRFLRFAALLVLVVGVFASLFFPAMQGSVKNARKMKAAHAASMRTSGENADFSYSEALDAPVDGPGAKQFDALKSLEQARLESDADGAADPVGWSSGIAAPAPAAPPATTAPVAAAPEKPAESERLLFNLSTQEKKKPVARRPQADYTTFAKDAEALALTPEVSEPPAPPQVENQPAPVVMYGIAGGAKPSRQAGADRERRNAPQRQQAKSAEAVEFPRQEARQVAKVFEDAPSPGIGYYDTASAADPFVEPEMAEAVAGKDSVDDWKQNFSALGAEVADAPADVAVAAAPAQPAPSSEVRAGVAQDAEERKNNLAAGETLGNEPFGNEPVGGGRLRYARSSSGGVAEKPLNAAMKVEAQLKPASGSSTMVAQDLAEAVDSDEDVFNTEGTVFKAKRKGSGESRDKSVKQDDAITADGRVSTESLQSEQRASEVAARVGTDAPEDALVERMKEIVIPEIDFRKANVSDIATFLSEASREFGGTSEPTDQRGVNIVLKQDESAESFPQLSMNTRHVTLKDTLDMVSELANLKYRIQGNTVMLMADAAPEGSLVHRMFRDVADLLPDSLKANFNGEEDFNKDTEASKAIKAFFGELGVEWPSGSTCVYHPDLQSLIVLTSPKSLDALEAALDKLKEQAAPPASVDFGPFTLIPTAEHPLSTFGLDVDSAGYSRAVSLIDEGSRPEASAIRQEEFINAFDYGDLAPAEATFRVYLEGAASPFRPGNHLLRVGVKGRRLGREEQRPLMLTILLDASGSMDTPERMALAKRAIEALLAKLSPGDTVTLLTCSDKTRTIFTLSGWDQPETAKRASDELAAIRCQGATNLEDGIVRAFESASADFAPKAENRVVILSDGIANLGSANAEEILAKVAANRDRGVSCSVIGVGRSTYNDTLLEAMANRGNGQYRFLDSEASIHESFVEDLQNSFNTIAADVKIQVEWNLGAVKAYRSHGYDSRALRDEQFRDDSVDAGEVGSGQGVTVVYEMQLEEGLKPAATLGTVRIRYRRVDTGAVEEIEAPIAAEALQRDFARARPQFRLACAVAEFATVLKHVPPAAQANALQPVAAAANRAAAELDFYAPVRGFADAVRKLMALGL